MPEQKKCQEPNCSGILDVNGFMILQKGGCALASLAYPCNVCGRLHKWDGPELVFNRHSQRLFRRVENGKVFIDCKDSNNNLIISVMPGA
ncbi:MAG: hypothetical protein A2998_01245 [Candidatus Staskawiczbacteria bacterium RIFCSPLOWO2_01_FULL_37_25b]|uniref:Uncharacterized protein n=2 Tax=Candidatus Staskawicziibacteriota TaxID=1817916 RepID=A0A1G2HMA0_9BACT|nr:MAG: hypothetical protein A2812_03060 [Candidatus Staskawiczbacteria bacterium RIFCSPHIGHO2_01_FULL_36_16]OGZ72992.1 MAG: hypothetical protein A2998_01245 [Candidatus Staskawiczbacteria bacterium RIFCSPLOWO2_01_FULL_37_25b]